MQNVKFTVEGYDFFKCGEYVISQNDDIIMIVKSHTLPDIFSGTIVASRGKDPGAQVGMYVTKSVSSFFRRYKGTITVG